ncbi:hypothetical protein AG1IA_03595 [Rhizoctonia solani AG-1 IA]|uniref:Uncharacterized protein n=1 Tax=Thanatephorus cucumeris (strain AG1-IA) TaxID=983506 RepID=L8WWB9_THACA|nr:hypothetical protein AG1IA_03595 [Rhizoctonia solani AG-1 IA]
MTERHGRMRPIPVRRRLFTRGLLDWGQRTNARDQRNQEYEVQLVEYLLSHRNFS